MLQTRLINSSYHFLKINIGCLVYNRSSRERARSAVKRANWAVVNCPIDQKFHPALKPIKLLVPSFIHASYLAWKSKPSTRSPTPGDRIKAEPS